ncbi:MAG: sigma-70 family RNA polymerase sigma factor [Planctomycetota bacterium]
MSTSIRTRASLVGRLRDHDDHGAWSEFVDLYGPLIYRFGRRRGLQDADSADLAQDVLREVSQSIGRFEYDPSVGRFRGWLFLITRRVLHRRMKVQKHSPRGSGDSGVQQQLAELPNEEAEDVWETEYRTYLFDRVSRLVQAEFTETTWSAFQLTSVEGQKPTEVAQQLGLSVGAVYVAKNRVLQRIRERLAAIDETAELT